MLANSNQARPTVPQLKQLDRDEGSSRLALAVCRVVVGGEVGDHGNGQPLGLRPGDLLLAVGTARVGDLCVLLPRGRGRPLVGRITQGGLVAEPSGVPCCTQRWCVAGRLEVRPAAEPRGLVIPFPRQSADSEEPVRQLPLFP
jgi:hypothetical protein